MSHSDRCVNPFRKAGEKGHSGKNLQKVSKSMLEEFPHLSINARVCSNCVKKYYASKNTDFSLDESIESTSNMDSFESSFDISSVNPDKTNEDKDSVRSTREIELEEMLDGLKQKFMSLNHTDPLRLQILTIVPFSWSVRKICREFSATRYLASRSKKLKSSHGVLADTTAKKGNELPQKTIEKVIEFYNSDENSRVMPGVKIVICKRIDGKRIVEQKRLLLLNLKELYASFKESNPEFIISFSKFAKLRPNQCILPGASGTHSVCVCTIHQNIKLMLDAIDITKLTLNTETPLTSYKDCLKEIICKEDFPDCYLDKCDKFPGPSELLEKLHKAMDDSSISHVQCSVWAGTDRSTLLTQTLNIDEYIIELRKKLEMLKPHSFIAKQQSIFTKEKAKSS